MLVTPLRSECFTTFAWSYVIVKLDLNVAKRYKRHMADEIKTERITILFSPSELKTIDDWSFEQRIRSRGEAIRRLIELGLKAAEREKERT